MKANMIKHPGGTLTPADEESEAVLAKVKKGEVYKVDITVNQNYRLHQKIFGFFAFCTQHYYGDIDAHKDEYKLNYVRGKLTVIAGYFRQMYDRNGVTFELVPLSISYEKMPPEEKGIFYKRITDAALKRVFDRTTDERILNQLVSWF